MQQKSALRVVLEPIAIAIVLALAVRSMIEIYSIPSDSMEPALRPGDHVAVTPYRFGSLPQRGQVVVFRSPRNLREYVIKRVIAVPGDFIATTSDGCVTIGGHIVSEPYLRAGNASGVIPPQIVPSGCYFVMGDNRRDSLDSRSWGVLPAGLIVGRARMILWSSPSARSARSASASSASAAGRDALHAEVARFFLPVVER